MVRTTITGRWQVMPWVTYMALSSLSRWYERGELFWMGRHKALYCKTRGLIAHDRILRPE